MQSFYCYILQSIENPNLTYNGATTDLNRRIRQHNRELVGGAKATGKSTWKYIAIISGFKTWNECLACEWRIKHPNLKKQRSRNFCGVEGRIRSIEHIFQDDKFTSNHIIDKDNIYVLSLDENYKNVINNLPPNVIIDML